MKKETSFPKTTRPSAAKQREQPEAETTGEKINRKLDAFPDKIDVRDWFYQPSLRALPDQLINCDNAPLILNQGEEGACTGFALAAVINYQLVANRRISVNDCKQNCISPRMLYEMARRYDEWPGEQYEGSSARGTMKGWMAHGVVLRNLWADDLYGPGNFNDTMATAALNVPAGAFYRVMHREVRDMHAALNETGILYATLMVHEGWHEPKGNTKTYQYTSAGKNKKIRLPVIERQGRADNGHAIAVVGYTKDGFIIQNSWGDSWGNKGFALLPYEDWMLHASDCWVVQIGVPVEMNLWNEGSSDTSAGMQRASQLVPLEQIRPFVINIGNNGFLSDAGIYWTTKEDVTRLFTTMGSTAKTWQKKRIMLYLHGGLNSEKDVAKRIISYKQVCLDNEIYPVHVMWETDFFSSMKDKLFDVFTTSDRANAGWLNKFRSATMEILDRTFELSSAKIGTMLWDEMKQNARLAASPGRSMEVVAEAASKAFQSLQAGEQQAFELHIVGHSAGCIFTAYTIQVLSQIGVPIKSIQFMAPAITIDLFKEKLLPLINAGKCPQPTVYMMSDVGERDDQVGPYGKSLLYLVSNAFERIREKPLLGMERFVNGANPKLNKEFIDKDVAAMFGQKIKNWPSLVISGMADAAVEIGPDVSRANSHGGFDNDYYTLNSVLYRILEKKPARPFTVRDLQ